jgi:Uma2 family endonuclease
VIHAAQVEGKYLEDAPAIAVEVISPSNTAKLMDAKMAIYFQFGAREVWRVNPKERAVTIDLPDTCRVISGDGAVTMPLIPGFSLSLAEIYGR